MLSILKKNKKHEHIHAIRQERKRGGKKDKMKWNQKPIYYCLEYYRSQTNVNQHCVFSYEK